LEALAVTQLDEKIALWAVACNRRLHRQPDTQPAVFQPRGHKRLIHLATRHGRWLSRHAARGEWDRYLHTLALLALGLREGVFQGLGRETAAHVVYCLLADASFQPPSAAAIDLTRLIDAVGRGEHSIILQVLRDQLTLPIAT
jgi:hypothetical protein